MGIIVDPWYPEREKSTLPTSSLEALVNLDKQPAFQFGFGIAPDPVAEKPKKKRKKGKH